MSKNSDPKTPAENSAHTPRYQVERWEKTGGWHYAVLYQPTEEDRRQHFGSYPPGDDGPFYLNAYCGPCGFETESEAIAAAEQATQTS